MVYAFLIYINVLFIIMTVTVNIIISSSYSSIQLVTGRDGNRKYIRPEEPAIARRAAEGNSWFRGANILSVAQTSSQQLFCCMTSSSYQSLREI